MFEPEEGDGDLTADGFDYDAWYLARDRLLAKTRQGRLLVISCGRMTADYQVVPSGFDITGCDERGRPVHDAKRAVDFDSDITGVTVIDVDRILVHGSHERIDLGELSEGRN